MSAAVALGWCDAALAETHVSGTISTSTSWTTAGSPYILDGSVTVASAATLTIQPGVVVKFNGQFRTLTVNGILNAAGFQGLPIVFTSIQDDTIGGDSNGDGSATQPAPGQWYHIHFSAGSTASELRWVEVRYGGYGSASYAYGGLSVSGSVLVADSYIHHNERSGIKIGSGGSVTLQRSTVSQNQNGISANMGSMTVANSTIVANSNDGVWFNLVSSYAGPASTVMDSTVAGNGGDGVEIGVDRTLATARWPHGNRNNIYGNASNKQLQLGSYHPVPPYYYDVDWKGNFWGGDVYYWYAPALCLGTAPNSPGHLAYTWSNPAPGPGGLTQPPDGPLTWRTYLAGTGNNVAYCGYDRFLIGPDDFSRTYITTAGRLPLGETQSRFAPELHYDSLETYRADAASTITDNYTATDSNTLWTSAFGYLAASDPSYPADTLSLDYLGPSYPSSFPNSQATSASDYIDEINDYEADAQRLHGLPQYANRTYSRYLPLTDGGAIVQYWFFFYYNGPRPFNIGVHEGDWEMMQIRVDAAGQPRVAAYAQHNGGERCDWIHVPRTPVGQPIVYIAHGSHASYYSSGTHLWDAGAVADIADGQGEIVSPTLIDVTAVQPRFLSWPGKWGASGSSPGGPQTQGAKWSDPPAWEAGISGCTEGQTYPFRGRGLARPDRGRPPLPHVTARREGDRVVIEYAFARFPEGRNRRPWSFLTAVDPAGNRYPPLTYRTRIEARKGRFSRPLGLGRAPYRVLVSVMAKDGTRSRTLTLPLR